jgi:hypothetical protein
MINDERWRNAFNPTPLSPIDLNTKEGRVAASYLAPELLTPPSTTPSSGKSGGHFRSLLPAPVAAPSISVQNNTIPNTDGPAPYDPLDYLQSYVINKRSSETKANTLDPQYEGVVRELQQMPLVIASMILLKKVLG